MKKLKANADITAPEVRLVAADGTHQVLSLAEALKAARDAKLDLVEVAGMLHRYLASPAACRAGRILCRVGCIPLLRHEGFGLVREGQQPCVALNASPAISSLACIYSACCDFVPILLLQASEPWGAGMYRLEQSVHSYSLGSS